MNGLALLRFARAAWQPSDRSVHSLDPCSMPCTPGNARRSCLFAVRQLEHGSGECTDWPRCALREQPGSRAIDPFILLIRALLLALPRKRPTQQRLKQMLRLAQRALMRLPIT